MAMIQTLFTKALMKWEGPNICREAHLLNLFFEFNQLPAAKKGL